MEITFKQFTGAVSCMSTSSHHHAFQLSFTNHFTDDLTASTTSLIIILVINNNNIKINNNNIQINNNNNNKPLLILTVSLTATAELSVMNEWRERKHHRRS